MRQLLGHGRDARRGAEDFVLRDVILESDGTHDLDPDAWPILHFYKDLQAVRPEAEEVLVYKLFVYCHDVGAIGAGARSSARP